MFMIIFLKLTKNFNTVDRINPKSCKQDKDGSLAAMAILGLPSTALET
jgi:hypothetical protein